MPIAQFYSPFQIIEYICIFLIMRTLAVVIGNNDYFAGCELTNAVGDANAIADVFRRLGYNVMHNINLNTVGSEGLLQEFARKIGEYDASIFYFAGHGFQLEGENYLTMIDCQVANPNKYHCDRTCIRLTEILDILRSNSDKVNLIIIDACRRTFDRGTGVGFKSVHAPKGTMIAFSTSPNEGAQDSGGDGHSVYTDALLRFIGRERLSVEELFKKVRQTVYNQTEGRQTTWEHTSLIGDFYFNTGQLVHSLQVPYVESVVKDKQYQNSGSPFDKLIFDMRSSNWDRQNPAVDALTSTNPNNLNSNQQFLLGRNLLQASDYAYSATGFFDNLANNIVRYSVAGENHVLNGILFEIYFNGYGDFRRENIKCQSFEKVMALRTDVRFSRSFDFINALLVPFNDFLFWIPSTSDTPLDVDVVATEEMDTDFLGSQFQVQLISRIVVGASDITKQIANYGVSGLNQHGLEATLASFFPAPRNIIRINTRVPLTKIAFPREMMRSSWVY